MKTAVEFLLEKWAIQGTLHSSDIAQAKEMEKEQKIKMLKTFLYNTQTGEDVEDVENWFEQYETSKQQEQ